MTTSTSSTGAVTSDIATRVARVVQGSLATLNPERLNRLREAKRRAEDLTRRGLLRRDEYKAASSADMERLYLRRGQVRRRTTESQRGVSPSPAA